MSKKQDKIKNNSIDENEIIDNQDEFENEQKINLSKDLEEKINDYNLTEKSIEEIKVLEVKLNEINIDENKKSNSNVNEVNQEIDLNNQASNDDEDDIGEITVQLSNTIDDELKNKINEIKSELNSELSIVDRVKNFFKPKAQKEIEQQLIKDKAIQLNKVKKNVKYVQTNFKSTIGLFSVFYSRNDMKWRVLIACLVGIMMGLVSFLFIQNTGVVITGMSGIFQGIARIVKVALNKMNIDSINSGGTNIIQEDMINTIYSAMFYGTYLLANIPLIIFSYKSIGKNFTILSTIPVVLSNVIPLLLNLIPGTENLFIFGKTLTSDSVSKYGVGILTFLEQDAYKFISMFIYTVFAGILNGIAISMVMAVGGSTGGLDFISFYFSYKKNKSLGAMLLTFNICSVFLTTMLGSYIPASMAGSSSYEYFFSQNLLTGFIYAITLTIMVGNLFPKDKVVKISMYSRHVLKIRNHLYSNNFNHSITINTTTGGYSMTKQENLEIICMFIEIPKILFELRKCDPDGLIAITKIKGIDGKLTIENTIN